MTTIEHTPTLHAADDATPQDRSAQSLLFWLACAMLVVTGLITLAITSMGVTAGIAVAFGGLIAAMAVVFAFIMRFIGPEDH